MAPTLKLKRLPNGEGLPLPTYTTPGAAGMDICSAESMPLRRGETKVVKTGFAVEVPEGYELQIRSRSGLAARNAVFVTNGIGTIDSDYRGELMVILSRVGGLGDLELFDLFEIKRGDRIAQLVLVPVTQAKVEEVEELSTTVRGSGGLGSTGV
jgi:dUTP pyrophosphatase